MRVLTGYIPATEGRAVVAGYDVFEKPIEAKRRTGYLPETPPLYPDMTVREYLHFVAKIKGVAPKERTARVEQVMSRTWVSDMAGRACGKLSKGYRQRVGLAQALIHNPEVLILDEPTAGLDPKQIIETRRLIKELAGDHTIILSTHILPEVSQTCERVVIINKGKVVGGGHAREPDAAAARLGNDVRAGGWRSRRGSARGARARAGRRACHADRRPAGAAFEIESEAGPRRAPRAGARHRCRRLGAAGAPADAHEPRGDLPLADNRGASGGGRP